MSLLSVPNRSMCLNTQSPVTGAAWVVYGLIEAWCRASRRTPGRGLTGSPLVLICVFWFLILWRSTHLCPYILSTMRKQSLSVSIKQNKLLHPISCLLPDYLSQYLKGIYNSHSLAQHVETQKAAKVAPTMERGWLGSVELKSEVEYITLWDLSHLLNSDLFLE